MFVIVGLLLTFIPPIVTYHWAVGAFPWLARRERKRALIAGFVLLALVQAPLYGILVRTHSRVVGLVHLAVVLVAVTLAFASMPLALLLLGSRGLPRWARRRPAAPVLATTPSPRAASSPALPSPIDEGALTRRQVVEGAAGIALFAGNSAMLGWGIERGRHDYRLIEVPVRIAGLPRALDGYVIVQVSDIHSGEFVGERELDEGLALARRARPDLLVVTGDLVDYDPVFAPLVARKLTDLAPRDGVAAILGNHDYYAGAAAVAAALRAGGVEPLVNAGKRMRASDGGGFSLLGVADVSAKRHGLRRPDLDQALSMVSGDGPHILLSHQPPTVDLWAGRVALQLSGHTHGGQINPGGLLMRPLFEYIAGAYEVSGTTLYVNRGFGTVGPPARVGVPPEVTRIVLVAA
jgi:uncharacterized protein